MSTTADTVKAYLDALAPDRLELVQALRSTILQNMDPAFEEGLQYGMLGYYLPHRHYPEGYHVDPRQPLPFASIASQKRHVGIYLFCIYCSETETARFREAWLASGKRLDMGKSCVRVRSLEEVPLSVLADVFRRVTAKRFVAAYEAVRPTRRRGKARVSGR